MTIVNCQFGEAGKFQIAASIHATIIHLPPGKCKGNLVFTNWGGSLNNLFTPIPENPL